VIRPHTAPCCPRPGLDFAGRVGRRPGTPAVVACATWRAISGSRPTIPRAAATVLTLLANRRTQPLPVGLVADSTAPVRDARSNAWCRRSARPRAAARPRRGTLDGALGMQRARWRAFASSATVGSLGVALHRPRKITIGAPARRLRAAVALGTATWSRARPPVTA
jgi:hypothetical protein